MEAYGYRTVGIMTVTKLLKFNYKTNKGHLKT